MRNRSQMKAFDGKVSITLVCLSFYLVNTQSVIDEILYRELIRKLSRVLHVKRGMTLSIILNTRELNITAKAYT